MSGPASRAPRALSILGFAAIAALGLAQAYLATKSPLHSDEILWKYHYGRSFLEGAFIPNYLPACPSSAEIAIPWAWYPARAFSVLVHESGVGPSAVRAQGTLSFLVAGLLAFLLGLRLFEGCRLRAMLLAGSMFLLGLNPLLGSINRPEQGILLAILSYLVIACGPGARTLERFGVFCIVQTVFCLWLLPQHPKATFFLPLFWVPLMTGGWSPGRASVLALLHGVGIHANLAYARVRVACPEFPSFQAKFASAGFTPVKSAAEDPWAALLSWLENLWNYPQAVFNAHFGSQYWLSPHFPPDPDFYAYPNALISAIFFGVTVASAIAWLRRLGARETRRDAFSRECLYGLSLFGSLALLMATDRFKAFYATPLIFPLGVLAGALVLRGLGIGAFSRRAVAAGATVALLASQAVYVVDFATMARTVWSDVPRTESHYVLTALGNEDARRREIEAAAERCDLRDFTRIPRLFLDEGVYALYGGRFKAPKLSSFLDPFFIPEEKSFYDLYSAWKASGLITRCDAHPTSRLHASMLRTGRYCCLPAHDRIARSPATEGLFRTGAEWNEGYDGSAR